MLKFGFSVFLVACALQCMMVSAAPVAPKKDIEIVGEAIVEVAKALKEFSQSVWSSIASHATLGFSKAVFSTLYKAVVIVSAAESNIINTNTGTLSAEEQKERHISANAVVQLRERLDKMEKTEQLLDKVSDEVAYEFVAGRFNLKQGLKLLAERLDRAFRDEPTLREAYVSKREELERNFKFADYDPYQSSKVLLEEVMRKLTRYHVNKLFLHHIDNRVTNFRKEYFVLARSMVEMAKDPKKSGKLQSIYDNALSETAPKVDHNQVLPFKTAADLFGTLRENVKKFPSLDADLQRLEKDVANRKDWDKGIWDLDLFSI